MKAVRASDALAITLGYALVAGCLLLAMRHYEPVRVGGSSMEPALSVGDVAIVRRGSTAATGEIVLVRRSGQGAVLHRVVRLESDGSVVTRGDANAEPDSVPATADEVVGRLALVVPVGTLLERWRPK